MSFAIAATLDAFGDGEDAAEEAAWIFAMHVEEQRHIKRSDMRAARAHERRPVISSPQLCMEYR